VPALVRSTGECFLRAHHAELISLGIGKYSPRLITSLADVNAACSERKKAVNLLIAVLGAARQVDMHAVLDCLWVSDRHEADPDGSVVAGPMTISRSRSDRTFQPSASVQNLASAGRSWASITMW